MASAIGVFQVKGTPVSQSPLFVAKEVYFLVYEEILAETVISKQMMLFGGLT